MKLFHADAFTDKVFKGNPAAVCLLSDGERLSDDDMQSFAAEFNLSETAFLSRINNEIHLRWFTPQVEVDLCGHATLASAHVLWESGFVKRGATIEFRTKSGVLSAYEKAGRVVIDLPAKPTHDVEPPNDLLESLGVRDAVYIGRSQFDFLIEIDSVKTLKSMWPNMSKLERLPGRGLIITARSDTGEYDFVSRFFSPQIGVDEDPVTGSAHCVLAPYWAKKLNKTTFTALQASKRGGVLYIDLRDNRVLLSGSVVTVYSAEIQTRFLTEF
ncbi:phenazine biosynthesis protein [Clostridia bacterium]|nr:phenazine biosynthesis protein [Clostridia bacterium]